MCCHPVLGDSRRIASGPLGVLEKCHAVYAALGLRVWGAAEQKTGLRVCPARSRRKKISQIKHIFPDRLSASEAVA